MTDLLLVAQWAKSNTTDPRVFNAASRLLNGTHSPVETRTGQHGHTGVSQAATEAQEG